MSDVLTAFLAGLAATLVTDEEKIIQPVLDNYTTSLVNDPSLVNASVQSLAFPAQVEAVAPQAASTGIKDTAMALKALIDVQLPKLAAAVAAEATAAGTPAAPAAPATPA